MLSQLFLCCACVALAGAVDFKPLCGPYLHPNTTHATLPDKLVLPPGYLIDVLLVDSSNDLKETAALHEEKFDGSYTLKKQNRTGKFVLLKRSDVNIYGDENGLYRKVDSFPRLFEVPMEAVKFLKLGDSSLVGDLVNAIATKSKDFSNTSHLVLPAEPVFGDIPAIHWVGCHNETPEVFLQVDVLYADNAPPPPSANISNPVMLGFDVTTYSFSASDNKTKVLSRVSFQLTFINTIDSATGKENQKLPRGTYCENMPPNELPLKFPNWKFEATFQYTDSVFKNTDTIQIDYDFIHRITMFTVGKQDLDLPALGHVVYNNTWKSVDIVHDFDYGLQYVLSPDRNICYGVTAIDEKFGDVYYEGGKLDIRHAEEMLIGPFQPKPGFYYDGEVVSDAGQPLDKYVTKVMDQGDSYSVVEILLSKQGWTYGGAIVPQKFYSISHFHKNAKNELEKVTTIRLDVLNDLMPQVGESGTQWTRKSILSCLKFTDDSYLYVKLSQTSVDAMKKVGIDRVGSVLSEALAEAANVSVLRIAEPYYRQDGDDVYVYFALGDESNVKPAETTRRKTELPLSNATAALNATLSTKGIEFAVTIAKGSTVKFTLKKDSFGIAPSGPPPAPVPSFQGYSKGSMFVLGIFMFIFGTLASVGGLLAYWRFARGRIGGHVYQVFE